MTQSLQQKVISGLAALTIGVGVLAAAAPAQAKPWHHHHHGGAIAAGVIGGLALVEVRYTFTPLTPLVGQIIGQFTMSSTTVLPIERTFPNP